MPKQYNSKLLLWLQAARPKTLPAAVAPVAVASALAFSAGKFDLLPIIVCLICAMTLQIAVNFANDYFDHKNNIDSADRLGPVRVTQSGLIPPHQVKRAMILTLILAALLFIYLVNIGGMVILIMGIASIAAALAYSGGPYPLASHGLGELFVFIFFGLAAVCGSYFILAGELRWLVVLASFPPGLLITAIMVVNNLRDIETDRLAGKNTLAVFLGHKGTIIEYTFLVFASYLIPLGMVLVKSVSFAVLLPLLTIPYGLALIREVRNEQGRVLNDTLAKTARLSLIHSLLFSLGLIF